jgi:hypothetical protein
MGASKGPRAPFALPIAPGCSGQIGKPPAEPENEFLRSCDRGCLKYVYVIGEPKRVEETSDISNAISVDKKLLPLAFR